MTTTTSSPISFRQVLVCIGLVLLVIALSVGGCAGAKSFNRYQKRADAHNQVQVTRIKIQTAKQQVQIQQQLANVRVAEADGIRRAQDKINKTLTPLYVQHEAIQAQERIATSGRNNTVIYVPATTNGTPVITQGAEARGTNGVTP